jgi:Leucine-rich repeat (LRR) protein
MKRIFLNSLFLLLSIVTIYAKKPKERERYHSGDVSILRRADSKGLNWENSDPDLFHGVYWSNDPVKRVVKIRFDNMLLKELDISGLSALKVFINRYGTIDDLDLSSCSSLEYANVCRIKKLDVRYCSSLDSLEMIGEDLENIWGESYIKSLTIDRAHENVLDFSDFSRMEGLYIENCDIKNIDLSGLTKLKIVEIKNFWYKKKVNSVNLTGCTNLLKFECRYTYLNALDLSSCSRLKEITCHSSDITSFDFSNSENLKKINLSNNKLKDFNIDNCPLLERIELVGNDLTEVSFSNLNNLNYLDLSYNSKLSSISELSGYNITLNLTANSFTSLDNINSLNRVNTLIIKKNKLKSLHIKNSSNLYSINCDENKIEDINLHGCNNLTSLNILNNPIKSLKFNNLSKLVDFEVSNSRDLKVLKVENCRHIEEFTKFFENLEELSFAGCTSLKKIAKLTYGDSFTYSGMYKLKKLNLSGCPIENINLEYGLGSIETIDISDCKEIKTLNTSSRLKYLNITGCVGLQEIRCDRSELSELVAGNNALVEEIFINKAQLTEFNINKFPSLKKLYLEDNPIESIDISNHANIETFVGPKGIASINFDNCIKLSRIELYGSKLKRFIVNGCPEMGVINISYSRKLEHIDVSKCKSLTSLKCNSTALNELDLRNSLDLYNVDCSGSNIRELLLPKTERLHYVNCSGNELTYLDVSNNSNLQSLSCSYNELTGLNIEGCDKIISFSGGYNRFPFSKQYEYYDKPKIRFGAQKEIMEGVTISLGETIDYDGEREVGGVLTEFEWFDQNGKLDVVASSFKPTKEGIYYCKMKNTSISNYTVLTTKRVVVSESNGSPTDIKLSGNTILENSYSESIGKLSVDDIDNFDIYTYTIEDNDYFEIDNKSLKSKTSLNFEDGIWPYTVTVTVEDYSGNTFQKDFEIFVTDINDNPDKPELSNTTVDENSPIGTVVGTISSFDEDKNTVLSYSIWDGSEYFSVIDDKLVTKQKFDFESKSSYSVEIWVKDGNRGSSYKYFTISVNNINESPYNVLLNNAVVVNELQDPGTIVGDLSAEDYDGDTEFTFEVVDSDAFEIIDGNLVTKEKLDYETHQRYKVKIRVTDSEGASFVGSVIVEVEDENEPPISLNVTLNEVSEDAEVGSYIGYLVGEDPEPFGMLDYYIQENPYFELHAESIAVKSKLDFETANSIKIKVWVSDIEGLSLEKEIVINVKDVNERPTEIILSTNNVAEDCEIGQSVIKLTAIDQDIDDNHVFRINENPDFSLVGSEIIVKRKFDFENEISYKVMLTVTDRGNLSFEKEFDINITDVNESPINIELSSSEVNENENIGTIVGLLTSVDPDNNDNIIYSVSGIDSDNFSVVDGKLVTSKVLDYEKSKNLRIAITATDKGGLEYSKEFTISVLNKNEAPFNIELSGKTITENESVKTLVGLLSAEDADEGEEFTYSLIDNDDFIIEGSKLLTNREFDFENKQNYNIAISVRDKEGLSYKRYFIIVVENVNEYAPSNIELSASIVNENQDQGFVIGELSAVDKDLYDKITFSIENNDNFEIVDKSLITKITFDYELKKSYVVSVIATDKSGLKTTKEFNIEVNDVNEQPTDIRLSVSHIDENKVSGTIVGALSVVDPDNEDNFIYTVSDTDNFTIDNNNLITNNEFNFESESSYSVTITVKDKGGFVYSKPFVISVLDCNEAPFNLELSSKSVIENNIKRIEVGRLSADDVDLNDELTYTLSGNDDFVIDEDKLLTNKVFDCEENNTYMLRVSVTDKEGLVEQKTFTINIINVNEFAPSNIQLSSVAIDENRPVGTVLGKLSGVDKDLNDNITFTIVDNKYFEVEEDNVKTKMLFDFEKSNSYDISIIATDIEGLETTKTFTISIEDVNEVPTDIVLSALNVSENREIGEVIGSLTIVDQDNNDNVSYSVSEPESFAIVDGKLITNRVLNYENKDSYNITIKATDKGGLGYSKDFIISIIDENEAPFNLELSENTIFENVKKGTVIGVLSADDVDNNDKLHYFIEDNPYFEINEDRLKTKSEFNYNEKNVYNITVTVKDNQNLSISEDFEIHIKEFKTNNIESQVYNKVCVCPNPCIRTLNIHCDYDILRVQIFDISSKIVYDEKFDSSTSVLDIGKLLKGIYFIKIYTEDFVETKRIVKQ